MRCGARASSRPDSEARHSVTDRCSLEHLARRFVAFSLPELASNRLARRLHPKRPVLEWRTEFVRHFLRGICTLFKCPAQLLEVALAFMV
jgi:hypothetical protein